MPDAPAAHLDEAALNAALAAYVQPTPGDKRLLTFLQEQGLAHEASAIKESLDALIKSADDHLWAQVPGVQWSEGFEAGFFLHLSSRHEWLSPSGFASLLGYARWLCWHEGLNA